jgi:hypothetical protein
MRTYVLLAVQVSLQPGQTFTLHMPQQGGGAGQAAVMDGLLDALMAGDTAKLLGGVGSILVSVTVM